MSLYDFDENAECADELTDADAIANCDGCTENMEISKSSSECECVLSDETSDNLFESKVDDSEYIEKKVIETKKRSRKKRKKKTILREIISFVVIILVAFMVAILINIYVIRTSNVVGTSMEPTLKNGSSVLISRIPYAFSEPQRGDIIVFDESMKARTFFRDMKEALSDNIITGNFFNDSDDSENETFFIKRVIGISGDVITVKDWKMYLNGKLLENAGYKVYDDENPYYMYEGKTWTVNEGYVFVMGDNRNSSKDSRIMGCIPIDCIMGKVVKE